MSSAASLPVSSLGTSSVWHERGPGRGSRRAPLVEPDGLAVETEVDEDAVAVHLVHVVAATRACDAAPGVDEAGSAVERVEEAAPMVRLFDPARRRGDHRLEVSAGHEQTLAALAATYGNAPQIAGGERRVSGQRGQPAVGWGTSCGCPRLRRRRQAWRQCGRRARRGRGSARQRPAPRSRHPP